MQAFRGDVVHGKCKQRFLSSVQRAISNEAVANTDVKEVNLIKLDVLTDFSQIKEIPDYKGSDVIFVNLPKVWDIDSLNTHYKVQQPTGKSTLPQS